MGIRRFLSALLFAFLLFPIPSGYGRRGQAYIDDVHIRGRPGGEFAVDFRVKNAMDSRVLDTVESGLPVRFTYWIRIENPREFARDRVLVDHTLIRILEKDNLKDRYRVSLAGQTTFTDFETLEEAIAHMTLVEGVRLVPIEPFGGHRPLFLRIKAQLQEFRLPFHLHYVLVFLSYLNVETDWYSMELPPTLEAPP